MTTHATSTKPYIKDYSLIEQLPDPPREPDILQEDSMYYFYGALRPHFANRGDVLISGAGYLLREAADAGKAGNLAPDGVVAFGVSDPPRIIWRNGYVISEVGKPPDFVLDVASRSTGRGTIPSSARGTPHTACWSTGASTCRAAVITRPLSLATSWLMVSMFRLR